MFESGENKVKKTVDLPRAPKTAVFPINITDVLSDVPQGNRYFTDGQVTLVLFNWASPVQAFASRKSPLRTAILFPNSMSFSGPSEAVHSFRLTIPRCTRNAVWINSVISAKLRWL